MLSVTADSNVYVSALIHAGPPSRLLAYAGVGAIRLDLSAEILTETLGVMRDKFGWSGEEMQAWRDKLRAMMHHVEPTESINLIEHDPADNRILECAAAAKSDYIVTADNDLLRLKQFRDIRIIKASDFLAVLLSQRQR